MTELRLSKIKDGGDATEILIAEKGKGEAGRVIHLTDYWPLLGGHAEIRSHANELKDRLKRKHPDLILSDVSKCYCRVIIFQIQSGLFPLKGNLCWAVNVEIWSLECQNFHAPLVI